MFKKTFYLSFTVLFFSCSNQFDQTLLIGNWKTSSWIENTSNKQINNKMDFEFKKDSLYEVDYGSLKEKGKYWVSGEYLHTIEDGQAEKMVKLMLVTQDSIVFEMNRTGTLETVVLTRK